MNEVIINNSRRKLLHLLLLGLVMVFAALYTLYFSLMEKLTITVIIGSLATIFFGFSLTYTISLLINPTPMLIISTKGIIDKSTAVSIGFIPWSTIVGFKVENHSSTTYIGVEINNTEELLKTLPFFQKLSVKFNLRTNSSPLLINISSSCAMDYEEVLNILNQHLELSKQN